MKNLEFIKMEAIGNNFVLINGFNIPEMNWPLLAVRMSAHHFGAGSDGLLVVLPSKTADLRMRMFNPDGSEDSCGNGLRSTAVYAYQSGICRSEKMTIESRDGIRQVDFTISDDGTPTARVNMGEPSLLAADIPALVDADQMIDYPLEVDGTTYLMTCVLIGSPHVFIRAPLESFWDEMPAVSALIETHPIFPERISVNWYAPVSDDEIKIRTWERAVGPTLGCGTGGCAAMVNASIHGLAGDYARITSPGGTLFIEWPDKRDLFMSGPANVVYYGNWLLKGDEEV
jgi:diaminopimelate epimerase